MINRISLATLTLCFAALALAGCGLAETTAVAASQAELAAKQAKEGKELEEKVKKDIADAQAEAAKQRDTAEQAGQ
jgi:outer membrane lipopolysaccharide assembly protein LptE/RlpB